VEIVHAPAVERMIMAPAAVQPHAQEYLAGGSRELDGIGRNAVVVDRTAVVSAAVQIGRHLGPTVPVTSFVHILPRPRRAADQFADKLIEGLVVGEAVPDEGGVLLDAGLLEEGAIYP